MKSKNKQSYTNRKSLLLRLSFSRSISSSPSSMSWKLSNCKESLILFRYYINLDYSSSSLSCSFIYKMNPICSNPKFIYSSKVSFKNTVFASWSISPCRIIRWRRILWLKFNLKYTCWKIGVNYYSKLSTKVRKLFYVILVSFQSLIYGFLPVVAYYFFVAICYLNMSQSSGFLWLRLKLLLTMKFKLVAKACFYSKCDSKYTFKRRLIHKLHYRHIYVRFIR